MDSERHGVPKMSPNAGNAVEVIDSPELAKRLLLPESWVRDHTRARTPSAERIPCVRFGRYVRFLWGSKELENWVDNHREGKKGCGREKFRDEIPVDRTYTQSVPSAAETAPDTDRRA
jgi:hypothetical protein